MPDVPDPAPGPETESATPLSAFRSRLRIKGASAEGKPPESSSRQIFLIRDGQRTGPFKREVIETLLRTGQADPKDLGWQEGQQGWRPLQELVPGVKLVARMVPTPVNLSVPKQFDDPSFAAALFGTLAFPFRGDGLIILVSGSLMLLAVNLLLSYAGILGFSLGLFATGYFFGALQIIVQSSAHGEAEMPRWPDLQMWTAEAVQPLLLWVATLLACFGPALLAAAGVRLQEENTTAWGFAIALGLGGFLYYPMALLGVALSDSLAGVNPVLVFRSIALLPGRYAAVVALLALLLALQVVGGFMAEQLPVKLVGHVWNSFNSLYFAVVQARVLGVFYHANREQLQWF